MADSKFQSQQHQLVSERDMSSCEMAGRYVREMTDREAKGWGDQNNALKRLSRRYGMSYWTLNNLRIGRSKTVEASIFKRVQSAYFDYCERQIAQLQHDLEIEKAVNVDAHMEDFMGEASQLLAKVREAKKATKGAARTADGGR